ncbi:hypothetical protein [Umezawaea sp.]|uniref:hypothetical protein n=1 Tax=Umezawaea sp. TaxID=1955258 RepID=UPI002ED6B056
MKNYEKVQLVAYGTVTSAPVRVLPPGRPPAEEYDADMKTRGATLCKVANWIQANHSAAVSDPTVLKVLVVPEFYFRFGGPVAADSPPDTLNNSYPDAVGMISNLIGDVLVPQFSTDAWNDWIIIAGSAFWHVPAARTTNGNVAYFNTSIVINGGELPEDEPNTNDDPATVPTLGRSSTNQKALMSRIDWSVARGNDRSKWDAALNPMFTTQLTDDRYLRWHLFKTGGKGNRGGRSVVLGVEVCLEHVRASEDRGEVAGVLRVLAAQEPQMPPPDVHVVTSCGMDLVPTIGVATAPGGIAMICDGAQPDTGIQPVWWPHAEVRRTTGVTRDGVRLMARGRSLGSFELPDGLQVGAPGDPRTPRDAVSIWEPVDLP